MCSSGLPRFSKIGWLVGSYDSQDIRSALYYAFNGGSSVQRLWALHVFRTQELVDQVVLMAKDPNTQVRVGVACALGLLGGDETLDILAKDEHFAVRRETVYTNWRLKRNAAVLALTNDPHNKVRRAVVVALDQLGEVEALTEMSDDVDMDIQQMVSQLLAARLGGGSYWGDTPKTKKP